MSDHAPSPSGDRPIVETERLTLRRFVSADIELLVELFADPEVMRFSLAGPRDRPWCERRLEVILDEYRRLGFGLWRVDLKSSGRFLGYCGLKRWPDLTGRQETQLGYRFLPDAWGRGIGTEALLGVVGYALGTLGLERLVAVIEADNVGSWRIAEKIGMTREDDLRIDSKPTRIYALTRQSFSS